MRYQRLYGSLSRMCSKVKALELPCPVDFVPASSKLAKNLGFFQETRPL